MDANDSITTAANLLDEAKKWFDENYVGADLEEADWESDKLPFLARLSVCTDPLPGLTGATYADAIAELVGEITYAEEGDQDYEGCDVETNEDECSSCHRTEMFSVTYTTDRRLAAKYQMTWVLVGDIDFNVDRDHKGRTSIDFVNATSAEAEYDEGEENNDAGATAYLAVIEKARAEAQARAGERAAMHKKAMQEFADSIDVDVPKEVTADDIVFQVNGTHYVLHVGGWYGPEACRVNDVIGVIRVGGALHSQRFVKPADLIAALRVAVAA